MSLFSVVNAQVVRDRAVLSLQNEIEDLKQKVHCYELEKDILEEKIHAQNEQIAGLKKEINRTQSASQEFAQGKLEQLEKRLASIEQKADGFIADLKQLKTHANDTSLSLTKYGTKITDVEQSLQTSVGGLKNALQSLVQVVYKGEDGAIASNAKTYKVQPGDSLERIAKKHGLSVDAIKKLNHLNKDRINAGQELVLGE